MVSHRERMARTAAACITARQPALSMPSGYYVRQVRRQNDAFLAHSLIIFSVCFLQTATMSLYNIHLLVFLI